jgi:putative transposase
MKVDTVDVIANAWEKFPPGLADRIQNAMDLAELPPMGREYIRAAIERPSRRVGGGTGNVCGRFASQKMGITIEFESRTVELSRIYDNEANPSITAYFSQPEKVLFKYMCIKTNRVRGYLRTPDFIEISGSDIYLVECKTEKELRQTTIDRPEIFTKDANEQWRCPPGEAAAAELGFKFKVISEADFPPIRIRNLKLLMDYISSGKNHLRTEPNALIVNLFRDNTRLTIAQILRQLRDKVTSDDIYRAIGTGQIACDLDHEALVDHERFYLYRDTGSCEAYSAAGRAVATAKPWLAASVSDLSTGKELDWDGRKWRLLNIGQTEVTLANDAVLQTLPRTVFNDLHKEGRIVSARPDEVINSKATDSYRLLQSASPADIQRALVAHKKIKPYLEDAASAPSDRTSRRALSNWRAAEASMGNGFVGLLPGYSMCGNRTPRLSATVLDIVTKEVSIHYANPKKIRRIRLYERIADKCKSAALRAPSYGWMCGFLKRMPGHALLKAREGRRAAYAIEDRHISDGNSASHKSDRPFEAAHIDHTQTDVEILCSKTSKKLGRPWLTTLVDDYSRDILAWWLTFEPPSYRSVLMTIRDCVRKHGRLPDTIVLDGGKEFQSIWFETTMAFFGVNIVRRPAARPRFGSKGERMFGTINSNFFHILLGNTQLRKNVRQLTKEVDPDNLAVWTFSALSQKLDRYVDEYRNLDHRELLVTPKEAFERGLKLLGERPERRIVYDQSFLICTCPTTVKGFAKVQPDGVKINYLYYQSTELRLALGESVPVRFDPANMGVAYALVNGAWTTLQSRFFHELKNRTEREMQVAREEFKRRRGQVEMGRLTDGRFISFLHELDAMEDILIEHHRAIAEKQVRGTPESDDEDNSRLDTDGTFIPAEVEASVLEQHFCHDNLFESEIIECEIE